MAKIADVVKLKSGYANFVELKSAFEAAQENANRMAMYRPSGKRHTQSGVLEAIALAVEQAGMERGFSPNLDWSHYRALMKVEYQNERLLN